MVNTREWSIEFDQMYNNIMSNQAPGLNEYEKSLFLTRAEENVVIQLYNGSARESFEVSEEITKYLSHLVRQDEGELDSSEDRKHLVENSAIYKLPDDLLFRIFEKCIVTRTSESTNEFELPVIPVTHDDLWRIRRDPFKRDGRTRVLRLTFADNVISTNNLSENEFSELITKYNIIKYVVRYLAKPEPIILKNLDGIGLTINGKKDEATCMLPEVLHPTILTEAVRLAKSVWSSNN